MSISNPHRGPHGRNLGFALRARLVDAIAAAAVIGAALVASPATGQSAAGTAQASVAELKRAYLWCSRAAIDGELDQAGIMGCSVVYEALKDRAFDGDFDRLHAWSQQNPMDARASR